MVDGAPLLAIASIRDFQGGKVDYIVDAMDQALLLPGDMAKLRSMRRYEVFLSLKRYLAMVWSSLSLFFLPFFLFPIIFF